MAAVGSGGPPVWRARSGLPTDDPLRHIRLLRRIRLNPDGLGGNPDIHVVGTHVFCGHGVCSNHRIPAHPHTREHRGVVGNPDIILQYGARTGHVSLVYDAVGMAVDVGVVGDADAIAEGDATAVVDENSTK
jgi:hypothetical protein